MQKIDFVLPWVDGNDPIWQKRRSVYAPFNETSDSNTNARFRDMGTLKYVLRSIEKYCPWYHKIYLITEGHFPNFLDKSHEKLVHITHHDLFIDPSHLPVFNSVAIEMNLVNLTQLSENFVYMNDDFIIYNPLEPSRFFIGDKPVDFFSHSMIARNRLFGLFKKRDTWIHSLNNVLRLYNSRLSPYAFDSAHLFHPSYSTSDKINNFFLKYWFKKLIWINHWHHPQALRKNTLQEVYNTFKTEMLYSSQNRFRSNSDLNQYMYRYWHLVHGEFHPYKHNDGFVSNIDSHETLNHMIEQLHKTPHINFVCFNDSPELDDTQYETIKHTLQSFLEERFPQKASFEK